LFQTGGNCFIFAKAVQRLVQLGKLGLPVSEGDPATPEPATVRAR
jgi:hypothetical protein